jgi:hypothetical protein
MAPHPKRMREYFPEENVLRMRRYRGVLLIAAALGVLATGTAFYYVKSLRGGSAHLSPALEILSQIPVGSSTLVYIDLAAIRASTFYQNRPDHSPLTIPNSEYADFIHATGFDFEKDLDRVAIASWPQSITQEKKKTVAVAEGRFDREKIYDYAKKNGKLEHQQGREVFLFPARIPNEWNSLLFLDDHRIAMTEGSSIAPELGPQAANSAADPVRERSARVNGAAVFVISRVPPIPDNFAPGGMQTAQLAGLARSVQWVTLAARPEGGNLRVSLEGECQTSTDARQLQSTLEALRMFGRAALESPKARESMNPATFGILETMLKTADITEAAERVRILVEITPDIFKVSGAQTKR